MRVLIVGAGAAGSACAWSLQRSSKFDVHVWEALPVPGGVASSCTVDEGRVVLNDQVQGGSSSYRHNTMLLQEFGFKQQPVNMRISFGIKDKQWTNHSPSELTTKLQPEIEKFGRMLHWVKRFEPLFVFIPIHKLLKWWGFSEDFRNQMIFPLVALFFGTGNQTPNVAAAIIARVFLDPDLRLFDYCPKRLLNSVPEMFAFPLLQDIWTTVAARSSYKLHCSRAVAAVVRSSEGVTVTDEKGVTEHFDEIVFACDAETVLKLLGKGASSMEKRLLGNVHYYTDYCLTHTDEEYMARNYDMKLEQQDNYFVRTYPTAPDKIEMSFNLSTYQPQLKEAGLNVYQTYYLDSQQQHLWTDHEVSPKNVLAKRWMRQFAHTWTHFASWVPWARFIQGKHRTLFCGSYTLVNTQEIAMMSGLAAAERLGADYPFPHDPLASSQFDTYYSVAHGKRRRNHGDKAAAAASKEAHDLAVSTTGQLPPVKASLQAAEVTTATGTKWFPPGALPAASPQPGRLKEASRNPGLSAPAGA